MSIWKTSVPFGNFRWAKQTLNNEKGFDVCTLPKKLRFEEGEIYYTLSYKYIVRQECTQGIFHQILDNNTLSNV